MAMDALKINVAKHAVSYNAEFIKAVVKPLEQFGINIFNHFRIYEDNSGLDFTTIPEFCDFFVKNHLYREGCIGNYDEYHDGYYFWDTLLGAKEVFDALQQQCNTAHGILIVKTAETYCDHFIMGVDPNKPWLKNFFITQKDYIEQFIQYYLSEADQIISCGNQDSYYFPSDKRECEELTNPSFFPERPKGLSLINSTRSSGKLSAEQLSCLTKRELQCIYYTSLGYSAKLIADILSIARKTVERHLENIRYKLGVRNKLAMISLVNHLDLDVLLHRYKDELCL